MEKLAHLTRRDSLAKKGLAHDSNPKILNYNRLLDIHYIYDHA
uniref:Uncharacterized protein n=1 Tax=Anguilla anguilla TaxID=7936 RepID=A0A0E9VVF6_ANGAN